MARGQRLLTRAICVIRAIRGSGIQREALMEWNTDNVVARREVLKWASMALAGTMAGVSFPLKVTAQAKAQPLGTARFAIFIQLTGAMSQMDCWDYKETKWAPKDLDPQKVWGDLYLPKTLFGRLMASKTIHRMSYVRSILAREYVNFNVQMQLT